MVPLFILVKARECGPKGASGEKMQKLKVLGADCRGALDTPVEVKSDRAQPEHPVDSGTLKLQKD